MLSPSRRGQGKGLLPLCPHLSWGFLHPRGQSWADRAGAGIPTIGAGIKAKDLCLVPFEMAKALRDDGWWLRDQIIWSKSNPMPESVRDRTTKGHECIFMFSKHDKYY